MASAMILLSSSPPYDTGSASNIPKLSVQAINASAPREVSWTGGDPAHMVYCPADSTLHGIARFYALETFPFLF